MALNAGVDDHCPRVLVVIMYKKLIIIDDMDAEVVMGLHG